MCFEPPPRNYDRYKIPATPTLLHVYPRTRTHARRCTCIHAKNVVSTLRRPDVCIRRAHARPFGYISRAALIPVHIQSHPLILARSRRKKRKDETRHEKPTGLPSILVSCTCTLIPSLFFSRIHSSLSLFLPFSFTHTCPHRHEFSCIREDASPVAAKSTSESSDRIATGFSRLLIHSLTAPAWRSRIPCPSAIQFDPSKAVAR